MGATGSANLCATGSASARGALTLVEVVCATMIVGMMSVAALNSLGAATRSAESTGNRAVAVGLADALMTDVLSANYNDSSLAVAVGVPAPVVDRDHWKRQVIVDYVDPDNPDQNVASDQEAKRIRVVATHRGQTLAELVAIKTNHE